MKVGRNDPCPCGSGKKYKQCCLPKNQVISLQHVRGERDHADLMDRLLKAAVDLPLDEGLAGPHYRYYGGNPPVPDEDTADPSLDWLLFGYRSPDTGETVAERAIQSDAGFTAQEREQVLSWCCDSIPGFFHVIDPGPGELRLRRMWDATPFYEVQDSREGLHTGDLVMGWLLPTPTGLRFGFDSSTLPAEAGSPLEHLLREELSLLRYQRPAADWNDLYRGYWPRMEVAVQNAHAFGAGCRNWRVRGRQVVARGPIENSAWSAVAAQISEVMEETGSHPEEIAGGLRLWWDAVHYLQPRIRRTEPWVGAVLYLLSKAVYYSDETQQDAAEVAGTSAASVGERSREIDGVLSVQTADPRYADLLDPVIRFLHQNELEWAAAQEVPTGMSGGPWYDLPYDDTPQGRAEELIDQAWQATGSRRLALARQAIELWPDGADAYVMLGNAALGRGNVDEAIRQYQAGVEAGERALGPVTFEEDEGHFWGLIETRPYMRARFGLADALWEQGEHEAAIGHYEALLRLNPGDNQGVRYVLAARLVGEGDDRRLAKLLREHGDGSAIMLYAAALLAYRQHGGGKTADKRLRDACQANPHVPAYLLGRRPLSAEPPQYIGMGDESEAEAYVLEHKKGWEMTPGALQWLASRT